MHTPRSVEKAAGGPCNALGRAVQGEEPQGAGPADRRDHRIPKEISACKVTGGHDPEPYWEVLCFWLV